MTVTKQTFSIIFTSSSYEEVTKLFYTEYNLDHGDVIFTEIGISNQNHELYCVFIFGRYLMGILDDKKQCQKYREIDKTLYYALLESNQIIPTIRQLRA